MHRSHRLSVLSPLALIVCEAFLDHIKKCIHAQKKRGPGFNLSTNVPLESLGQSRDLPSPPTPRRPGLAGTTLTTPAGDAGGVSLGAERVKLTHDLEDPEIFSFCAAYVDGL